MWHVDYRRWPCKANVKWVPVCGPSRTLKISSVHPSRVLAARVADKSQVGSSANGLVHACYELYGGRTAGLLLSVLSRLLTRWDQLNGFTCRMDDLLLRGTLNGPAWNCSPRTPKLPTRRHWITFTALAGKMTTKMPLGGSSGMKNWLAAWMEPWKLPWMGD